MIVKNLPLLLNAAYIGFNRGQKGGDFFPEDGVTHCNQFINYVLNCFRYDLFNGKLANEMIDAMNDPSSGWITVSEAVGQSHSNGGIIVLAGWKNLSGHGHVSLILPGILEKSGSAGKAVPKTVSIGREVMFGKRLSQAFKYPDEAPTLYALASMIL